MSMKSKHDRPFGLHFGVKPHGETTWKPKAGMRGDGVLITFLSLDNLSQFGP